MDRKEYLEKIKHENDKLDRAYITLFLTPNPTPTQLDAARARVLQDFDDILRANVFLPDKEGHYDPYRAAVEDGSRKRVVDILKRIHRKFDEDDAKQNKVIKS